MATFVYRAKRGPHHTVEGEMNAESQAAVFTALDRMGYSPVWVREKTSGIKGGRIRIRRRVSDRAVTVLCRQLASLIRAGVPILRALVIVARQCESPRLAVILDDVAAQVRNGSSLSDALARHPATFPELFVNLVRAGEFAAALDTVLLRFAETREGAEELRRKVQSALAYPCLVILLGLGTVFVLLAFFLPRVTGLFHDARDLPLPTQILMTISHLFSTHGHWLVLLVLLSGAILHRLATLEKNRGWTDRIRLRIPLFGRLTQHAELAQFSRTLALLLTSGIPIERALELSGATLRNRVLRESVAAARRRMTEAGATLSSGLQGNPWFPPLMSNLIAVGEESGHLEQSLLELAAFYERELEHRFRLFVTLLEPSLILIVGGLVGYIVAAMLLPIFRLGMELR